jgi:hypothetical protein
VESRGILKNGKMDCNTAADGKMAAGFSRTLGSEDEPQAFATVLNVTPWDIRFILSLSRLPAEDKCSVTVIHRNYAKINGASPQLRN